MNRKPETARLYLDSGTVLYVAEPDFDQLCNRWATLTDESYGLPFVNTDGRKVVVRTDGIVSVVSAAPEPDVAVEFAGKKYTIRGITKADFGFNSDIARDLVPGDTTSHVLVTAEDLAETEVAIVDLSKPFEDAAVWLNPAQPTEANELVVRAVFMLARAEQLYVEFNMS